MHSNTVTVEFRIHHNNQRGKAIDALLTLLEDSVDGPQEENNIEFVVTETKLKEVI